MIKELTGISNFHIASYAGENEWDIPSVAMGAAVDVADVQYVSLSERCREKDRQNAILHGFSYDYQINCLWRNPSKYLKKLQQFRAVITPDYSVYTDLPRALRMHSAYKRQWLGRFWQENGVNVINCLSWAEGCIEDWTFAGIPKHSPVALSVATAGVDMNVEVVEITQIVEMLEPCQVFIKASGAKLEMLQSELDFDFEVIPVFVPLYRRK